MKCLSHKSEAVGVCSWCGRGVCPECLPATARPRLVCSTGCEASLTRQERAIQSILQKSLQSLRASAFYCFLCGIISLVAGIVAYYTLPSNFLIGFCGACGIALICSGVWYSRVARAQDPGTDR